jgi:POT family proton-dependent oligopeptide transporter
MVSDFLFMVFAAMEFEKSGSSSMIWLVLAYLFHTIGALSFTGSIIIYYKIIYEVKYP